MTIYTISVQNQRGANTNYAIFMEPPQFSGGQQPWMNVWFTQFVPDQGSFEVQTELDFYAWTGTTPESPMPGVVVNPGMSMFAQPGTETEPGSTFDMAVIQNFPTIKPTSSTAIPGAFEIDTGTDFMVPNNNYLVGLAKPNNRGQLFPVASVAPFNNEKIQVTPKMKFFITESQQVPGEIVDYSAVSRDGATIDFSSGEGKGKSFALVVQGSDGGFTVTYDQLE
ncbi:hypothetical protein BDV27DRAFT_94477 [Aspergillus caelatus]|uniref:Uncharacterized protein n=1 Tax=Aspergillus caelatus TaxID=61420 RepID=A0A5N6ZHR6_9EURO|nr:uncharacterized protein BDV27DRAFT_94477 [Aspergillus caelatus]KAE8357181.1 hypothetical protein BDV27DRAFT_94477 [Aspergillus caelatus]